MANWKTDGVKMRLLPNVALQDVIDNPNWLVRKNRSLKIGTVLSVQHI
jgi:hypothetical protein